MHMHVIMKLRNASTEGHQVEVVSLKWDAACKECLVRNNCQAHKATDVNEESKARGGSTKQTRQTKRAECHKGVP